MTDTRQSSDGCPFCDKPLAPGHERECPGYKSLLTGLEQAKRGEFVDAPEGFGGDVKDSRQSRVAAALLNMERAARELDALFDGEPDAWRLDGVWVAPAAATALLSLHDYLNDVDAARTCICGDDEAEDDRSAVLRCPIHGPHGGMEVHNG